MYVIAAVNCTEDPFAVANDDTGRYDWDKEVANRSYLHRVNYRSRDIIRLGNYIPLLTAFLILFLGALYQATPTRQRGSPPSPPSARPTRHGLSTGWSRAKVGTKIYNVYGRIVNVAFL